MPVLQSGGSQVTSASIVDGEIVNADIATAAAIAQSKLAGSGNTNSDLVNIQVSTNAALSLTTVAGQRVVVIANGTTDGGNDTVTLLYNGVSKDTVTLNASSGQDHPFMLMYTEVPGAATQNVTVTSVTGLLTYRIIAFVFK